MVHRTGRMVVVVIIVLTSWTAAAHAADTRPNILFIMSDDHAAQAVSCTGSTINQTPNLDRIAAGGARFTNAFVTNSLCGPSRASLLTGKYSHLNGFRDNQPDTHFDGSQATFPKLLQQAGYTTAVIGKWHLNSTPTGFDHWEILPGQGVYRDPVFITPAGNHKETGYVTDLIADKVIDYLQNGRDKSKPFCVLCHNKAPHRSWVPDEKHAHLYDDIDIPEPSTFNDDYSHRASPAATQRMEIKRDLNAEDLKQTPPEGLSPDALAHWKYERFIKDYLRCIASVDDNVGRLLDYLDKAGLAQNTIVVYTSDNGFFLGEHGWFDKRFMYEQSLRVPLLVRFPGQIKPGLVSNAFTLNEDFAATFLDYANVAAPSDLQGHSLRPILQTGIAPANWRKSIYYHYYEYPAFHKVQPHIGLRTDRYKLISYYGINEWELFDLQTDPNELVSVYNDPKYADVRKDMTAELMRSREELKDTDALTVPNEKSRE